MEKIPSFTVDHLKLNKGIYVSRKDSVGEETVTTFDIRFTKPNIEPVMDTAAVHAVEHLWATFFRNDETWKENVIYFGPMGCRTGFYLILKGDLASADIVNLLNRACFFLLSFEGVIPGASAKDCGNYLDLNLSTAKYYTKKFYEEVLENLDEECLYIRNNFYL